VRRFLLIVVSMWSCAAAARESCDATPPPPTALRAAELVADYQPVLRACHGESGDRIAIREMRLDGAPALLLVNPATLETKLERSACWTCETVADDALGQTRMMRAIDKAAETPGLTHRSFLGNAGLTHGQRGGFFTGDLCPSKRPLDRAFLQTLAGDRTPIALSISGLWLKHHFADYRWLLDAQAAGRFAITWINHSYSHPYRPGVATGANFLLSPRVDADHEILQTERLLIANGQTPSLFFRFPGLVSSSPLMQAVRRHHLIALGANAWLALNQKPGDGSIILVHPNGNEEIGLQIYRRDAAKGLLPPLKPLDEAPE
jgi:hypothetical protein